jgi:hypothetical protein
MEQVKRKRTRTRTYPDFLEFLKAQTKRLREENKKLDRLIEERRLERLKVLRQARVLGEVK